MVSMRSLTASLTLAALAATSAAPAALAQVKAGALPAGSFAQHQLAHLAAANDALHAAIAREYAPRVRFHPNERYAIGNVKHFFEKFRLVLSTPFKTYRYDVDERSIEKVVQEGWTRKYTSTDPQWRDHWWFESKDGCEWHTKSPACDLAYLRAHDAVTAYQKRVVPEVYWRAKERFAGGRAYVVVQYFFLMMLNDAQNKHDGEWESSAVVIDKAAYLAAGADVNKKRAAIAQLLMAGHYRQEPFNAPFLQRAANTIFVPGTAHYRHVMSLGGHGGYLVVPQDGKHEAAMKCYEFVRSSPKKYDTWDPNVARMVKVDERTPWVRYAGRWGRRYGLLSQLPLTIDFSYTPVGTCEGAFGLGWIKSRVQVIISAPYGPMFIHQTAWNWNNFPAAPGETPRDWR